MIVWNHIDFVATQLVITEIYRMMFANVATFSLWPVQTGNPRTRLQILPQIAGHLECCFLQLQVAELIHRHLVWLVDSWFGVPVFFVIYKTSSILTLNWKGEKLISFFAVKINSVQMYLFKSIYVFSALFQIRNHISLFHQNWYRSSPKMD